MIQHRQICLGAKLIVSKSSNMNERDLKLQIIDFNDIFKNPKKYTRESKHNKFIMTFKSL